MLGKKEDTNQIISRKAGDIRTQLVGQREYMMISPGQGTEWIGTESIRGCYGITFYHPERSAIIHWDDNTDYEQISKMLELFLQNEIKKEDCIVTLIGGWSDNKESNEHGLFLKKFFENENVILNLDNFQKKKSDLDKFNANDPCMNDASHQKTAGFSLFLLNINTGTLNVSDNWGENLAGKKILGDLGKDVKERKNAFLFHSATHCQSKNHAKSGASLIPRNGFREQQQEELYALCLAAKENKTDRLIKILDEGIADINKPFSEDGWTALHFACAMKNFKCAEILIDHGANIYLINKKGNAPFDLIKDKEMQEKFELMYKVIQKNKDSGGIGNFSIFSRHPDHLDSDKKELISMLKKSLDTSEGRQEISSLLS